jgi:hypothetical protein
LSAKAAVSPEAPAQLKRRLGRQLSKDEKTTARASRS